MSFRRFFSTESVKGTKGYLSSQKKYEWIRTIVYFAVSLSLFAAGIFSTGSRNNLLTIVAVLGCLPASKSLVEAVMYTRYKGAAKDDLQIIEPACGALKCLYDCVFTTREKTYPVDHMAVCGNTVIGYMPDKRLSDTDCAKHLDTCLKIDHFKDVSIKIFQDVNKYSLRLGQLQSLSEDTALTDGICNTLKSISL
jgi:hypothetical protein